MGMTKKSVQRDRLAGEWVGQRRKKVSPTERQKGNPKRVLVPKVTQRLVGKL